MHRQDKQCSQPRYKACGTQSHHSLIPKASGHCTGPRRMEQGLLFLSWLFSLQNVALPLETALPLGFWAPLGNAVLQRRFHGCVTAVTCARACAAGDERQHRGDVPVPGPAVRNTEQRQPRARARSTRGAVPAGGAPGPKSGPGQRQQPQERGPEPRDTEPAAAHPPEKPTVSYTLMCKLDLDMPKGGLDGICFLFIFAVIFGK